jgi:tetratricopeptide (TPR) repeat protein
MSALTLKSGLRRLSRQDYASVHADAIAAIHADVNAPLPYFLLGVIASDHGNHSKALELFETAAHLDKTEPHYGAYRAMTLSTLRRSHAARKAADIVALDIKNDPHLSDMIGVVYSRCGYHEKAISFFQAATARAPKVPNVWFNLGASQQFLGDFDAAESAYHRALALDPNNHRAWSAIVSLRKQTPEQNALPTLEPLFAAATSADAKLHLGHAIAKTREDLGDHTSSLTALTAAKADKREAFPFDRDAARALYRAANETSENDIAPPNYPQDVTPIFIVGLPRTGTTLVDRILSSHSRVTSAGELNAFAEHVKIASGTTTPHVLDAQTLQAVSEINLTHVGRSYLDATRELARGSAFMVDKMPLNFFYAALMNRAFPNVKIIALRRGAMDSCLSNYRQLFSTQYSYYNYTYDLADTAWFYRQFDALMRQWREHLPSDRFIEIRYEDIVLDQENQTRRLLEFCDLPWEADCLRFHENTAAVSTASSVQVRQPLYTGSIGRWKKYGNGLDPLQTALGDLAD